MTSLRMTSVPRCSTILGDSCSFLITVQPRQSMHWDVPYELSQMLSQSHGSEISWQYKPSSSSFKNKEKGSQMQLALLCYEHWFTNNPSLATRIVLSPRRSASWVKYTRDEINMSTLSCFFPRHWESNDKLECLALNCCSLSVNLVDLFTIVDIMRKHCHACCLGIEKG